MYNLFDAELTTTLSYRNNLSFRQSNFPVIPTERSDEESLKHFKSDVNE